jgi:preprotein translocase subunit SecD
MVLDGQVLSAPVIREAIPGGSAQISGNFTVATANDLAVLLEGGALPAPLNILEERTVGPSLGADSVAAGKIAAIIGFTAVIIYIVISYGLFGVFANIALIINVALIAAILSVLQATLTLPGIAGIVLTIGMAVDANVLIFERIREEVRNGKTPINAIEVGYDKALTTILDANITTFIAAAILFQLGSGPVRGFAVTLGVGIITSVFTAFVVTRLIVALWFRAKRPKELVL